MQAGRQAGRQAATAGTGAVWAFVRSSSSSIGIGSRGAPAALGLRSFFLRRRARRVRRCIVLDSGRKMTSSSSVAAHASRKETEEARAGTGPGPTRPPFTYAFWRRTLALDRSLRAAHASDAAAAAAVVFFVAAVIIITGASSGAVKVA